MSSRAFTRRRFLATAAATAVAPYVRTSCAAGSLSVGFWDHWVPGANEVLTRLCNEWAVKEKVEALLAKPPPKMRKSLADWAKRHGVAIG